MDTSAMPAIGSLKSREQKGHISSHQHYSSKPNQVGTVLLYGIPIVSLVIDAQERLCLAQISNTLLKQFSYNEIHNRRVALGITCVQCTPVQLEILRRAGAMPVSSRRCGMITRREAERLCKSFLGDNAPPRLPDDFAFSVHHECAWGCRGAFLPSRYNSSRAKCIKCTLCGLFFSPNKFIFHSHRTGPGDKYVQPDAANFNSWRRHMKLSGNPPDEITHAWEDVKAMFNGGTRKRLMTSTPSISSERNTSSVTPPKLSKTHNESANPVPQGITFPVTNPSPALTAPTPRVPPFSDISLPLSRSLVMDYVWHQSQAAKQHHQFPFSPYTLPWLKRGSPLFFGHTATESPLLSFHRNAALGQESKPVFHQSAFRPVQAGAMAGAGVDLRGVSELSDDETVDIETTEDEEMAIRAASDSPRPAWTSPNRIDGDRIPSGGTSERSRTPASTHSLTAVHSTSPVILKEEGDTSPPLALSIPPPIRRVATYEDQIPSSDTSSLDIPPHHHQYERSAFFRDRPDVRGYHRDAARISPHHGYNRESLWSVARLSLERQDRGSDFYRPDVVTARSFLEARDKESDQSRNGSPGAPVSDCPSCSACRPIPQQALTTVENNNKLPNP